MQNLSELITSAGIPIFALVILGTAIYNSRRFYAKVHETLEKHGSDVAGKRFAFHKATVDFGLTYISAMVIIAGTVRIISQETVTIFLTAILVGFGAKFTYDIAKKE